MRSIAIPRMENFMNGPYWNLGCIPSMYAAVVFCIISYSAYTVYLTCFHPVSKIPGPVARKVSYLPCAYQSFRGLESRTVRELHHKFGNVVMVTPELVSFACDTAWKEIYGVEGTKRFKKSGYRQLCPGTPDLLTANGTDHARQRAALNRAFSERALREQEHHFHEHIDLLFDRLDRLCGEDTIVDLAQWVEFTAFDIIGTLAFGSSFNCLLNRAYHPWVLLLGGFFKATHYYLSARMLGVWAPLVLALGPVKDLNKGQEHLDRSSKKVRERVAVADNDGRKDFWTYISQQNDSKSGSMSVQEMEVNAALIIAAGSDTMSTCLSGCIYLLLKHPHTLSRLRKELYAEFEDDRQVTADRLPKLRYLQAVISEALRVYPPLPSDLRREVPREGAVICGQFIPGGTIVTVYAYAAHYNTQSFARPEVFAPERWLNGGEQPDWTKNDRLHASQPFSVGPRNCIGKSLAILECKLILARLILRYDMSLIDDRFDIHAQRVYIMWKKPPLSVTLKQRHSCSSSSK